MGLGNFLSGAIGGAGAGAGFGHIGAIGGGILGGLGNLFSSKPDKFRQVSLLSKDQQRGLKDYFRNPIGNNPLYQQGNNYLQNLLSGAPGATQAFEAPYLTQFYQQTVPQLSELFGGFGTGAGAQQSSAFQNALGQAGAGLSENLAALRSQLQMQALPQALGYAQQPYSNQLAGLGVRAFENTMQPGQAGIGTQLAQFAPYAAASQQGLYAPGQALGGLGRLFSGNFGLGV